MLHLLLISTPQIIPLYRNCQFYYCTTIITIITIVASMYKKHKLMILSYVIIIYDILLLAQNNKNHGLM